MIQPAIIDHDPLPDHVYNAVMGVPGAEPWHRRRTRTIIVPTAAFAVVAVLDSYGVPYRVLSPGTLYGPVPSTVTDAMAATMQDQGLHDYVLPSYAADFQKAAAAFCVARKRASIWAEPGGGKTCISVMGACGLQHEGRATPVLVITIGAVVGQQADEWRKLTSRPVVEWRAASRRRKSDRDPGEAWRSDRLPVIIISWDSLVDEIEPLLAMLRDRPAVVIFDEAQRAKNYRRAKWTLRDDGGFDKTDRRTTSWAAAQIAASATFVIATTATSIDNNLADLWGQATLIEPTGWGQTASRYLIRYCGAKPGEYGGLDVSGMERLHVDELIGRLSFTTLQIPYAVSHANLPAKRRMLIRVRPEDQVKPLAGMARAINAADKSKQADRSMILRAELAASRKRAAVVSALAGYARTGKGKIILFSGTRRDCEDVAARLRKEAATGKNGKPWDVFCSHGEDSVGEREQIKTAYMTHEGPCVLVATWASWGTGLNLDDTDVIAWMMLPFTPAAIAQGEGRGDRLSMTRELLYLYFIAEGTVDDRIVDLLLTKLVQVERVQTGGRLAAGGAEGTSIADVLKGIGDVDALIDEMLARAQADEFAGDGDDD